MGNTQADSGPASGGPERRRFVSVASRLALVIFALVAAVSLVIALELARRERGHYVESKRSAGEMLTELFAASIAAALDFEDLDAVKSSLDMLSQNKEVMDAVVWPAQGAEPFAGLADIGPAAMPRARPVTGMQISENHIDIVRSVSSPTGKLLGTVGVRVSLARENAAFASARRRIFWLAFGLSSLVAGLLVAVVRRTIVSPLDELEKAARRLARGELTLVMQGRDDEVGRLGRTFNGMANAIAEREEHISRMNERLQGVLDNMRQAIVVFDEDGCLAPERSRLARALFGDAAGPGTSIAELLYPPESASEVERDAFQAWLSEVAGAEEEDFDELLSLAPREVTLARATGEEQSLELELRRAPSEGASSRFMLLATDVTSQRHLERTAESQARSHEKQLIAMRRLLAGGGQVFVRFLGSARDRLAKAERTLGDAGELTPAALEELFRFAHTLRAEARSFDLEPIEALASGLELELSGARHTPLDSPVRSATRLKLSAGLTRLALELSEAEELFAQSSPIGRRVLEQVTVSRKDVDELFRRLGHVPGDLGELAARLAARPFGELLAALPDAVERWSRKEGKVVELVISGRETLVPATLAEGLGGVLAHLLRNAVAHGVETPAERRAKGKAEEGRIELSCQATPKGVSISVTDDGAGFDGEALAREAIKRGHAAGDSLEIAFIAGVSTRATGDDLAGYGVGLGAVREELVRVGYAVCLARGVPHGARVLLEPTRQGESGARSMPAHRQAEVTK